MQSRSQYETDKVPSVGIWKKLKSNRFLSKFANLIDPPDPVLVTKRSRDRIPNLLKTIGLCEKSLNVGSGSNKYNKRTVNFDLFAMDNVDVVGNSALLPFKDESFGFVICQAVLEHVEDPNQTVNEMHRVLKKDGIIYVEIPFFQGFHPSPTDFQRYTISGVQNLFQEFELLEKGILAGPSSALAWILREFLAILFSFNNLYLYRILSLFFGWFTLPLKYLDHFLEKSRFAAVIASGFFFLGKRKNEVNSSVN